jgi:hypothetical protein
MIKRRLSILLLMILSFSCIEELPLPNITSASRLVVDGMITQEPGPHTVHLFMTDSLLSETYYPVTDAQLAIKNNLFKTDSLINQGDGRYLTKDGFLAQIGKFYKLHIKLKDGRLYESEEQLLYPAGEIDELKVIYKKNFNEGMPAFVPRDIFQISIDAHGSSEQANKLRWRWRGVYEVLTNPELHTISINGTPIPDPLPCSGFLTGEPCICCNCWTTERNETAHVSKSETAKGVFLDEPITRILVDQYRFRIKYFIEIEQLSLSDEVYEFWKRIEAQQAGSNNIFQPAAIRIQGNIHPITNPKEQVLGIFAVNAVSRASRFLIPSDLGGTPPAPNTIANDCRLGFKNSTNIRPEFW